MGASGSPEGNGNCQPVAARWKQWEGKSKGGGFGSPFPPTFRALGGQKLSAEERIKNPSAIVVKLYQDTGLRRKKAQAAHSVQDKPREGIVRRGGGRGGLSSLTPSHADRGPPHHTVRRHTLRVPIQTLHLTARGCAQGRGGVRQREGSPATHGLPLYFWARWGAGWLWKQEAQVDT